MAQVDDNLIVNGGLVLANVSTPAQLTTSVNNYDLSLGNGATLYRLSSSTNLNITGFVAPNPVINRVVCLVNVSTLNITIPNNSASSTAGNRVLTGLTKATTTILQSDENITMIYDVTSLAWRVIVSNV